MGGRSETLCAVTGSWLTAVHQLLSFPGLGALRDAAGTEDVGMGSSGHSPGKGAAGERAGFLLKLWG